MKASSKEEKKKKNLKKVAYLGVVASRCSPPSPPRRNTNSGRQSEDGLASIRATLSYARWIGQLVATASVCEGDFNPSAVSLRANRFLRFFTPFYLPHSERDGEEKPRDKLSTIKDGGGLLWFMWSLRKHPARSINALCSKPDLPFPPTTSQTTTNVQYQPTVLQSVFFLSSQHRERLASRLRSRQRRRPKGTNTWK